MMLKMMILMNLNLNMTQKTKQIKNLIFFLKNIIINTLKIKTKITIPITIIIKVIRKFQGEKKLTGRQ